MNDVPKFVRQRMAQAGGGDHPDANLLAALSEGGLTNREREQVLMHLGTCAACRETLALAMPESSSAQPAMPLAGARWLRWPMLRWAGVGAAVVVVAAAVVIQSSRRPVTVPVRNAGVRPEESQAAREPETSSSAVPSPAAEQAKKTASSVTLRKGAPVLSDRMQAKAHAPGKDMAARRDERAKTKSFADKSVAEEKKNEAPSSQFANSAPAAAQDNNKLAQGNEPRQREAMKQSYSAMEPAKVQQQGSSIHGEQVAGLAATQQKPPQAPAPQAGSVNQSVEVAGQAGALQTQQGKPQDRGRADLDIVSSTSEVTAANRRATKATADAVGGPIASSSTAARSGPLMKAVLSAAPHWRLSTEGVLERSTDAGQSWHLVRVATPPKTLRSFSAVGRDIWAGGEGGALYHSADSGWTWSRVTAKTGDAVLDTDIVRVEFTDSQHGSLMTSSGEKWTTQDGGASWSVSR